MPARTELAELIVRARAEGLAEIIKLEKELGDLGLSAEDVAREVEPLRAVFERIANQRGAIQQFQALETELKQVSAQLAKSREETNRFALALSQVDDPKLQQQLEKSAQATERLNRQQQGLRAAVLASATALNEAGVDTNNLARAEQRLTVESSRAGRAVRELSDRFADLRRKGGAEAVAGLVRGIRQLAAASGIAFGAAGIVQATRAYLNAADTVNLLKARLQDAAGAQDDVNAQFAQIFQLAQRTRSPLQETASLYAQIARNADVLGLAQQDLLSITAAVNQSFQLSGSSQAAAAGATQQFIQAIGSGKLAGDELKSILEGNSVLAKALADALGVNVGALKDLGAQGVITSELLARTILAQTEQLNQRFERLPLTVGAASTQLGNSFTNLAAKFDQASGISSGVTSALTGLSNIMDTLADRFESDAPSKFSDKLNETKDSAAQAAAEQQKLAAENRNLAVSWEVAIAALDKYAKTQLEIAGAEEKRLDTQAKLAELVSDEAGANRAAFAAAQQKVVAARIEADFTDEQIAFSEQRIAALKEELRVGAETFDAGFENKQKTLVAAQQELDALKAKALAQQDSVRLLQAEADAIGPLVAGARLRAEAAEREVSARERATDASQEFFAAQIELNRAAQQAAIAQGNETRARQLAIEGLRLEVQAAADLAAKKREELGALAQTLAARQQQLVASKGNNTALQEEIAKIQAAIGARVQEIRALDESTKAKEQNAKAFQAGSIESAKRVTAEIEAGNKAREEERKKTRESTAATEENTQANQENADSQQQRSTAMNLLDGVLGETLKKIAEVNAAQQQGADSSNEALNRLNAAYKALLGNLELVNQFGRGGTAAFDPELFKRIRLIEDYRDRLAEATELTDRLNQATADGSVSTGLLAQATNAASNATGKLAEQDLAQFRRAIDDAKNKMRAMEEQTQSARDRVAELDAALARERGDTDRADALQRGLETQRQLREIEQQRREAEAAGNRELVALLDEQRRKVEQLAKAKDESAQRERRERERKRREEDQDASDSRDSGGTRSGGTATGGAQRGDINVNIRADFNGVLTADKRVLDEAVRNHIIPAIDNVARLRR